MKTPPRSDAGRRLTGGNGRIDEDIVKKFVGWRAGEPQSAPMHTRFDGRRRPRGLSRRLEPKPLARANQNGKKIGIATMAATQVTRFSGRPTRTKSM